MQFKKYTKQRNSIQGLRSFKDTLPKNIKKVINKKGHVYSETINNWKYIVGENLFKVCYPKSFKNSNKLGVSTLLINVKSVQTYIFRTKKYINFRNFASSLK